MNGVLYTGVYGGGVYKTTDGGNKWLDAGLTGLSVLALCSINNALYAGTWGIGVCKSTDGGNSWPDSWLEDYEICSLSCVDGVLYAGTMSNGIFKTTDEGASWAPVNAGLIINSYQRLYPGIGALYPMEGALYAGAGGYFGGHGGGIFKSNDEGDLWNPITGLMDQDVQALHLMGNLLYAGAGYGGVFKTGSHFGGTIWTPVNTGLNGRYIHALCSLDGILYAGTDRGVYKTTDGGDTWMAVNNGLMRDRCVFTLCSMDGVLYAGTEYGGVLKTTDEGDRWLSTGELPNLTIQVLYPMNSALYAGTYNEGVFKMPDEGSSWIQVNTGLGDQDVQSLYAIGDVLYAGTGTGVYKTIDEGAHWEPLNIGLINLDVQILYSMNNFLLGEVLYAGTSDGVFKAVVYPSPETSSENWKTVVGISASFVSLLSGGLGIFFYLKKCLRGGVKSGGVYQPLGPGNYGLEL